MKVYEELPADAFTAGQFLASVFQTRSITVCNSEDFAHYDQRPGPLLDAASAVLRRPLMPPTALSAGVACASG